MFNSTLAIRNGEFIEVPESDIDYVLDDNSALLSTHINTIPLQSSVATPRHFYGARFLSQADSLIHREAPLVQNEFKDGISFDAILGEKVGAVKADNDYEVFDVKNNKLILKDKKGQKKEIELYNNYSLNRKNRFHQIPKVKKGDVVKKGDILAYSNFTDKDGTMAMGINAKVAIVPYLGYTLDDATVISKGMASRLTSEHMLDYDLDNDKNYSASRVGFLSLFPEKFNKNQLLNIEDSGVVRKGTVLKKGDPIFLKFGAISVSSSDRLKGLGGKHLRNKKEDLSEIWEYDQPGVVVDSFTRPDGSSSVSVYTERPAMAGDKIVFRSGAKFTISEILDDNLMPRAEDGSIFEMLANPNGLPSRVNVNPIYELLLSEAAKKRGKPYVLPSYTPKNTNWQTLVKNVIEEFGLKTKEKVFDPKYETYLTDPVATGSAYVLKLHHQGSNKLSARGQGIYNNWEQPLKGGDEGAQAKRASGLEIAGLLSAGAYEVIRDATQIRGQKNLDYFAAIRAGKTPPLPGKPFAWDKMLALMNGSGYSTREFEPGKIRLGPLTDKDLDEKNPLEVQTPQLLDMKSLEPVPGGIFDSSAAVQSRWQKITLPVPIPNPAFETSILKLLGLKEKEFNAILSGEQDLNGIKGPMAIKKALEGINVDVMRQEALETLKQGTKTKKPLAINRLNIIKGLEKNKLNPADLIISAVPVIPLKFRPFTIIGETITVGDVNELFQDLIYTKDGLKQLVKELGYDNTYKEQADLYSAAKALYGHGESKNTKLKERTVSGFYAKVLGKSPKYSVFQRNLFSKPVDFSGRGVAGIDPTLGIDEISIPEEIAWTLFAPKIQSALVVGGMKPLDAVKKIAERSNEAKTVLYEKVIKEQPVLVSRAPAWHKHNILGVYVKLHDGKNIRVNPLIAKGMNLDYDGDYQVGSVWYLEPKEN